MTRLIGLLLFVSAMVACDTDRIYEVNHELNGKNWLADSVQQFQFQINDTTAFYNILCNIRNSNSYPYRNLYVKYSLSDSLGKELSGGLMNQELFDPISGKPLGSGLGDVFDTSFPLAEKLRFPYSGVYNVSLTQYMRRDTLPDILAVGIRVERSSTQ